MMFICTDNTIECHNMACNATNQCIHSFIRSFAVKRSCRLRSSNMLRTCIMEVSSNELTSSSLSFEPVKLQIKRRLWGLLTYWRLISQHIIIISTSLYVTVTWNQLAHAHVIFVEFLLEKCQMPNQIKAIIISESNSNSAIVTANRRRLQATADSALGYSWSL